jgi:hypothetical protein
MSVLTGILLATSLLLAAAAPAFAACEVSGWTQGVDNRPIFKCSDKGQNN